MPTYPARDDKTPRKQTEWTRLERYYCDSCGEECINHQEDPRFRCSECLSCYLVADLDRDRDRPDLVDPDSRQAGDVVSGDGSRAQDGQKPGTGEARARNVPRSEHGVAVRGQDE